jgi:uncharacterized protein YndB with AHSA1/START domain
MQLPLPTINCCCKSAASLPLPANASSPPGHVQDIRTGGRWKMEIHDSAKNETYWGEGEYLEVRPPEKIGFTWSWFKEVPGSPKVDMHSESPVTEVTVEFFDRGQQTELLLTHRGLGSERLRKEHEGGWVGCLNVLEKILQNGQYY